MKDKLARVAEEIALARRNAKAQFYNLAHERYTFSMGMLAMLWADVMSGTETASGEDEQAMANLMLQAEAGLARMLVYRGNGKPGLGGTARDSFEDGVRATIARLHHWEFRAPE